jgi:hypothetical protein
MLLLMLLMLTLLLAGAVHSLLFLDSSTLLVIISALICQGCSCRFRVELLLLAVPSVKAAPLGLLGGLPAGGSRQICSTLAGQTLVNSSCWVLNSS